MPSGAVAGCSGAETAMLEVRWMATGNTVCSVPAGAALRVSEVKGFVRERTGVPVEEQRLFEGSRLLTGGAATAGPSPHPLTLVRSVSDPRVTNLGHFRPSAKFGPLPRGAFSLVKSLATGPHGDVLHYRWKRAEDEESVAVKKLSNERLERVRGTETDERTVHLEAWRKAPEAEDALAEIGILMYLAQQPDLPLYLLRMLGVFSQGSHTFLVTEFADGGDLFAVASARRVAEHELRRYEWQLLQAVAYLHQHHIGHRDISLENVLLKGGVIRLMDFGMSVRSHSASGAPLRFFRPVGKDFCRAPEVYVPTTPKTRVVPPLGSAPGRVVMTRAANGFLCEVRLPEGARPGQACSAEVWGYAAPPADVFSCAVCLFMLAWQCPPWQRAVLSDPMFAFVQGRGDDGFEGLLRHWKKSLLSSEAMQLLSEMCHFEPSKRPSAAECLKSSWFSSMGQERVQQHARPSLEPEWAPGLAAAIAGA